MLKHIQVNTPIFTPRDHTSSDLLHHSMHQHSRIYANTLKSPTIPFLPYVVNRGSKTAYKWNASGALLLRLRAIQAVCNNTPSTQAVFSWEPFKYWHPSNKSRDLLPMPDHAIPVHHRSSTPKIHPSRFRSASPIWIYIQMSHPNLWYILAYFCFYCVLKCWTKRFLSNSCYLRICFRGVIGLVCPLSPSLHYFLFG